MPRQPPNRPLEGHVSQGGGRFEGLSSWALELAGLEPLDLR